MTTLAPAVSVSTKPEVVGKAIYLELTPILDEDGKPLTRGWGGTSSVRQLLLFPTGTTSEGHQILQPEVFYRTLSSYSPRAQWHSHTCSPHPTEQEIEEELAKNPEKRYLTIEYPDFDTYTLETKNAMYARSLKNFIAGQTLDYNWDYDTSTQVWFEAWKIRAKFAVEITDKDMGDLRKGRTPQAVIRRTNKARVYLGFPEKLV